MKDSTEKIPHYLAFIIAIPMALFGLAVNIYSGLIFFYQMYFWLKLGKFINASIYSCLTPNELSGKGPLYYIPHSWSETWLSDWLLHPNDWVGLQKIVAFTFEMIPIYILGIMIGTITMVLAAKIVEATEVKYNL